MIDTAVIPAAGYGTRLLPITKVLSKATLPLGTIPIMSEILWEAYNAGIRRAIIVTHWREETIKNLIESEAPELKDWLKKKSRNDLIELMERMVPPIEIEYIHQKILNGLGGAILLVEKHVSEPFCVMLSDNCLLYTSPSPRDRG